jgi:hypothetical protein
MRNTKTAAAVKLAYRKGYRVLDNGEVEAASGKIRQPVLSGTRDHRRHVINIRCNGTARPVPVHQLAAYQKFGEAAFMASEHVRHLNGDCFDNRPENIALGTASANMMDRDPAERRAHAIKASTANKRQDWAEIDADRASGMGYTKLSKKYGVSKGTLAYRYSKTAKYRRMKNR